MSGPWLLIWEGERWVTTNEHLRSHYHVRNAASKYWRGVVATLARQVGVPVRMGRIGVEVQCLVPHKGRRDPDADMMVMKFVLDGLADAGCIPDDTGTYVRFFTGFAPMMGADDWCLRVKVSDQSGT